MKINIECLIGVIQAHFDNERDYRLECKKKDWYKRTEEEEENYIRHERNQHGSSNEVCDLCSILNIDIRKLYSIARAVLKWEKKHNWQRCFPYQNHERQIIKYLSKENEFPISEIEYLHRKINIAGEKDNKEQK